jgi:hypothetical protein
MRCIAPDSTSKLAWMVMSMALTLAAARNSGFLIPDRSGHLLGDARRHPHVAHAAWSGYNHRDATQGLAGDRCSGAPRVVRARAFEPEGSLMKAGARIA